MLPIPHNLFHLSISLTMAQGQGRCSFGGKSGTWLRKKRKLSSRPVRESNTTLESKLRTDDTTATAAATTTFPTSLRRSANTVSEVIGWDDVRGRPIYGNPTTIDATSTSGSSNGNDSSDSEMEPASPDRWLPHTQEKDTINETLSTIKTSKTRKQRSYGGKRRNRVSTAPDDFEMKTTTLQQSPPSCHRRYHHNRANPKERKN